MSKRGYWTKGKPLSRPFRERLYEKIDRSGGPNACHLWLAHKSGSNSYGALGDGKGGQIFAHRAVWEDVYGKIPIGLLVLHKCDTPLCCNPVHLFLGTHKTNAEDRDKKGRGSLHIALMDTTGENNGNAHLSVDEVLAIRVKYATGRYTGRALARSYHLAESAMYRILKGQAWRAAGV